MDLKILLIDMAKAIVDNPDAVVVEEEINGDTLSSLSLLPRTIPAWSLAVTAE
jgi:hypothetical protein